MARRLPRTLGKRLAHEVHPADIRSFLAGASSSWDRIVDQRNVSPRIYVPDKETSVAWKSGKGAFIQMPVSAEAALPKPCASFEARQEYRIILFGEKASLESILLLVSRENVILSESLSGPASP